MGTQHRVPWAPAQFKTKRWATTWAPHCSSHKYWQFLKKTSRSAVYQRATGLLPLSHAYLLALSLSSDSIIQLQGETWLCLADDKNLGIKKRQRTENIKIQMVTNRQPFLHNVLTMPGVWILHLGWRSCSDRRWRLICEDITYTVGVSARLLCGTTWRYTNSGDMSSRTVCRESRVESRDDCVKLTWALGEKLESFYCF